MTFLNNVNLKLARRKNDVLSLFNDCGFDIGDLKFQDSKSEKQLLNAKDYHKNWCLKNPDKCKAYRRKYRQSKKYKLYQKKYSRSLKRKKQMKEYYQRPEIKERYKRKYLQKKKAKMAVKD